MKNETVESTIKFLQSLAGLSVTEMVKTAEGFDILSKHTRDAEDNVDINISRSIQRVLVAHAIYHAEQAYHGASQARDNPKKEYTELEKQSLVKLAALLETEILPILNERYASYG